MKDFASGGMLFSKPQGVPCETKGCHGPASFIYGPECESETGQLMYLCDEHAQAIKDWKAAHPNDPVECPTHGRIGKVKDYLVLVAMK